MAAAVPSAQGSLSPGYITLQRDEQPTAHVSPAGTMSRSTFGSFVLIPGLRLKPPSHCRGHHVVLVGLGTPQPPQTPTTPARQQPPALGSQHGAIREQEDGTRVEDGSEGMWGHPGDNGDRRTDGAAGFCSLHL